MTVYGWDASNWDDPISEVDGIVFYTHKIGEGHRFYYDREYRQSVANAADLGVPIVGAYFVNHPGSQDDQADWCVELLDQDSPWWRKHPCFIVQIDAERFDYMSRAPSLAEIQAFGDRLVQVHGVDPRRVLAYAPQWLYGNTLDGLTYRLWASNYGINPTAHYLEAYPGDVSKRWAAYSGQTPLILQYGSNLTIGNQTTCDANAFRGTLAELLAELGGGDDVALTDDEHRMLANLDRQATAWFYDTETVSLINGTEEQPYHVRDRLIAVESKVDKILALLEQGGGGTGLTFDQTVEAAKQGAELAEDS